jgi:hypothetical protein
LRRLFKQTRFWKSFNLKKFFCFVFKRNSSKFCSEHWFFDMSDSHHPQLLEFLDRGLLLQKVERIIRFRSRLLVKVNFWPRLRLCQLSWRRIDSGGYKASGGSKHQCSKPFGYTKPSTHRCTARICCWVHTQPPNLSLFFSFLKFFLCLHVKSLFVYINFKSSNFFFKISSLLVLKFISINMSTNMSC